MNALAAYHLAVGTGTPSADFASRSGNLKQAHALYTRALQIKPTADSHCGLGYVALAQGEALPAVRHFNAAAELDASTAVPMLGLATAFFHEGRYKKALDKFRDVLRAFGGSKCPPGVRLGIALCHERLGEVERACEAAERELVAEPRSAPALAVLAALSLQDARRAAGESRAAELEWRATEATKQTKATRTALRERAAALRADSRRARERGASYLSRALDIDPGCPAALVHAAELLLRKGDNESGRMVAHAAVQVAEAGGGGGAASALMCAAAHFAMGRIGHATGKVKDAETSYKAAIDALARLPSSRRPPAPALKLRYAQALVENNDALAEAGGSGGGAKLAKQSATRAALAAEEATKQAPHAAEAHRLLAALRERTADKRSAKAALEAALRAQPRDGKGWLQKATLLQDAPGEAAAALEAYKRAGELLGSDASATGVASWRVHNNAGVLSQFLGAHADADEAFARALAEFPPSESGEPLSALDAASQQPAAVVVSFNVALLREAQGRLDEAGAIYRALVAANPTMHECLVRQASMAVDAGELDAALEVTEGAIKAAEGSGGSAASADALCMKGYILTLRGDFEGAAKTFEKVRNTSASDSYATVGLANCNLRFGMRYVAMMDKARGRMSREDEKRTTGKAEQFMLRSLDLYQKALAADGGCAYAANGIGVILAERGRLEKAKGVFAAVHEALAVEPGTRLRDVWVNLAHCYLVQDQHVAAEQLYVRALARGGEASGAGGAKAGQPAAKRKGAAAALDKTILMCLARAYYDSDRLPEAKETLQRAMALDETDAIAAFDAAYVSQTLATKTFARHDKTAAECRAGMDELQEAAAAFGRLVEGLRKGRVSKESGLDAKKVEEHQRYCIEFTERARVHLQHAEESEKAARIKAEKEARAIEAELARIEAERVQKETAERERVEALERRAREHKDNFREMQAKWKDSEAEPEAKPRRAKKDADVDMAEAGNGLPDEEGDLLADAGLLDSDDDDGGDGAADAAPEPAADAPGPAAPELDDADRAALKAAGLDSDSDDDSDGGGDAEPLTKKRPASEVEEAAGADDVPAGLEDSDGEGAAPAAVGGEGEGGAPAKRRRMAVLDDDDD